MKKYEVCNMYISATGGRVDDYEFERVEDYNEKIKLFNKPEREIWKFKIVFLSKESKVNEQGDEQEPEVICEPMVYGSHILPRLYTKMPSVALSNALTI